MDEKIKSTKTKRKLSEMCMKDDPLYFLINPLHFGMKKHIFLINMVKGLIITYLQIFNVIGLIFICKDSQTYLQRYISGIFIQQIGISSYALMMYYTKDILHLSKAVGMFFLSFDATGAKVQQELLRQCAMVKKIYLLSFIILSTALCGLLPVVSNIGEYQFAVIFIKENFGAWSMFSQVLYYLCILSLGYSIGSLCCVSVYLGMHLKFQLHLLVSYLHQVSYDIGSNNDGVLYQDIIHERLISFVQAHVKIKTLSIMFLNIGKWSVLVTTGSCSLLYTSLVHFLIMEVGLSNDLIVALALLVSAMFTYTIATGGQQLQDESTNLYVAACGCKWVDWSIPNQRILLMIIINTSKTVKITSFDLLDLGNEIMLRMLKLTYSLVLLFLNVNK